MTAEGVITPGSTLRVLEPASGVLAFYDGRIPGVRLHGPEANWLDDGAFALAIHLAQPGDPDHFILQRHIDPAF